MGREEGETCSVHEECDKKLACRPSIIWPFETVCLPLLEIGSECESEYDCKPRNFCWKLNENSKSVCLEKHSAPDFTEFRWDLENYPIMNKKSVMIHGQYCKSGIASMMLKSAKDKENKEIFVIPTKNDPESKIAICLTIDKTVGVTTDPKNDVGNSKNEPFQCTPDGKTQCLYKKSGQTYFKLLCECGLRQENGIDVGYCPLPGPESIGLKNEYLRKTWIGDNCHTLDRHIFKAQLECGIGTNFGTLAKATENSFNVNYYPYIQEENQECME